MSTALSDLYEAKRDDLHKEQKELEGRIEDLERKIEDLGESQERLRASYLKALDLEEDARIFKGSHNNKRWAYRNGDWRRG